MTLYLFIIKMKIIVLAFMFISNFIAFSSSSCLDAYGNKALSSNNCPTNCYWCTVAKDFMRNIPKHELCQSQNTSTNTNPVTQCYRGLRLECNNFTTSNCPSTCYICLDLSKNPPSTYCANSVNSTAADCRAVRRRKFK